MPSRRAEPLTAAPLSGGSGPSGAHDLHRRLDELATDDSQQDRERRFAAGLASLRTGGGTLALGERTLMILGGIIAPLGLLVILIGWVGASRTGLLFEQIPYLISGGLFGLALVFLGSFFYFAHWLTELVKEHRAQSAAVVAAIGDLAQRLEQAERDRAPAAVAVTPNGSAPWPAGQDAPVWVLTARGSLAHRPTCVVVAGKDDLRTVDEDQVDRRCQLCAPEATQA